MATDLKPIRSETDYDEASREVEHLWGEKSGTPKPRLSYGVRPGGSDT
jgi:HTH-type transcriptional regulator/antitoxin HigA